MANKNYDIALELAIKCNNKRQEAEAYLGLGEACKSNNQFQAAIEHYQKALKIAEERREEEQVLKAFHGLGVAYKLSNNFKSAIDYFQKVLKIACKKQDKVQLQAESYIGLGDAYQLNNQIPEAINAFEKTLKIAKQQEDTFFEAEAYIWLGNTYKLNNEMQHAIRNYEKSLETALKRKDKRQETEAYFGLGHAHTLTANIQLGIKYYKKALVMSIEKGDKRLQTEAYFGLGDVYRIKSQLKLAIEYYEKALDIAKERGDKRQETDAFLWLGNTYRLNDQKELAKENYEKALEVAKEQNDERQEAEAHNGLGALEKAERDEHVKILGPAGQPFQQTPEPPGRDATSCYPMKKPYGYALIVNIKSFEGETDDGVKLNTREGSDVDVEKLKDLWQQLGFNVITRVDLKAHQIYTIVSEMAKDIDGLETSSCFVCCIMTHGDMGLIYGSDSKPLNIKDHITDLFKEEKCRFLAGKPKLFFIQACRGAQYLTSIEATSQSESAKAGAQEEGDFQYDQVNASRFRLTADPNEPHFLLGYSTAPGYVSFRSVNDGTWYVNALVEIFSRYHTNEDVTSMMVRVNDMVSKAYTEQGFKQCPVPIVTLTKKIYF